MPFPDQRTVRLSLLSSPIFCNLQKTCESVGEDVGVNRSVPNNDLNSPRVEKSTFTFSDKRKVAVSIEVNQGDHYCNAVVKDTKTEKTYKEFKYRFDSQV